MAPFANKSIAFYHLPTSLLPTVCLGKIIAYSSIAYKYFCTN